MTPAKARLIIAFATMSWAALAAIAWPAHADFNSAVAAYAQGNFTAAFQDFLELAKQRDIMAQDIVGMMYHRGNGVQKDDVQAYMWLDLAAHAGDPDAAKFRDEMVAPDMTPSDIAKARELSKSSPLFQEHASSPVAASPHPSDEPRVQPPATAAVEQAASPQVDQLPSSETQQSSSPPPTDSADPLASRASPSHVEAKRDAKRHWTIQIAAVQGKTDAKREWQRLQKRYSGLLRGLTPTVERVEPDAKHGSYYRVRVGAWTDKQAPDALCSKLKQRGERCLVLQRLS